MRFTARFERSNLSNWSDQCFQIIKIRSQIMRFHDLVCEHFHHAIISKWRNTLCENNDGNIQYIKMQYPQSLETPTKNVPSDFRDHHGEIVISADIAISHTHIQLEILDIGNWYSGNLSSVSHRAF